MKKVLHVEHLYKAFGNIQAVKDISFSMEESSLFALLGVNGAGKSTTLDILTTFIKPDQGRVEIYGNQLGKNNDAIRACIGVVFQQSLLDDHLTVKENLQMRASLYGLRGRAMKEALDHTISVCNLHEILPRKYGVLSGGQKRRCDIARALLIQPKILFLDEPTTGLDPSTRKMLWNVIRDIQRQTGMSVFLTTHYMEEATDANDIVILQNGSIRAQGTPIQLKKEFVNDTLRLYPNKTNHLESFLKQYYPKATCFKEGWQLPLENTLDALIILQQCKDMIQTFEVLQGTLDDAFLNIMQEEQNYVLYDAS